MEKYFLTFGLQFIDFSENIRTVSEHAGSRHSLGLLFSCGIALLYSEILFILCLHIEIGRAPVCVVQVKS